MKKQLTFESALFSQDYKIKDEQIVIGEITNEGFFSKEANSFFANQQLTFQEVGFWDRKVNICQGIDNQVGTIQLSNWSYRKATIKFDNGESLKFQKEGYFSNNWRIVSENSQETLARITNFSFSKRGTIDIISDKVSNNLIVTSLFLNRNYKKKMAVLIMTIFAMSFIGQ